MKCGTNLDALYTKTLYGRSFVSRGIAEDQVHIEVSRHDQQVALASMVLEGHDLGCP